MTVLYEEWLMKLQQINSECFSFWSHKNWLPGNILTCFTSLFSSTISLQAHNWIYVKTGGCLKSFLDMRHRNIYRHVFSFQNICQFKGCMRSHCRQFPPTSQSRWEAQMLYCCVQGHLDAGKQTNVSSHHFLIDQQQKSQWKVKIWRDIAYVSGPNNIFDNPLAFVRQQLTVGFEHFLANLATWLGNMIQWERCQLFLTYQRTCWTYLFTPRSEPHWM